MGLPPATDPSARPPAGHGPGYRRRRFIVDWRFQLGLVWHGTSTALIVLISVILCLVLPVLQDLRQPRDEINAAESSAVLLYMDQRLVWIVPVCLALAVLRGIQVSHRIAGPLVRFKRHLGMMGDKQLPPPLHTRPGDLLKPEVAVLNATVARLAERYAAMTATQARLMDALRTSEALLAAAPNEVRAGVTTAIAAARELASQIPVPAPGGAQPAVEDALAEAPVAIAQTTS